MSPNDLVQALERLARPRVLIVGDLILDRYLTGTVERISPEAPIPILAATHEEERLGGAGNVAANLRSMEAEVEVVGILGDDARGQLLREKLEQLGVTTSGCVVDGSRPTTVKTRMLSGVQQILRVDRESSAPIPDAVAEQALRALAGRVGRAQAVVLSDYGKGALSKRLLEEAIRLGREAGVPVLVDPKGNDYRRYRGASLVTPNRREAEVALGRSLTSRDDLVGAARELIDIADLDAAVITLGSQGMFHLTSGGETAVEPTVARAVYDVTGAGDTVIAHLALALGAGLPLGTAVRLANQAAGIVVGKRGAASVTRAELRRALLVADGDGAPREGKLFVGGELEGALAAWRAEGKRIVFTNGCFDVLHAGHVEYLRFARAQGDLLVVGVNDDESVRRLKGAPRPVNSLEDRMAVLAALEMVDAVVAFAEDTPAEIVERVTPDVLVKGEDWRDKGVVGREWVESHGGEVVLAPLLEGRSTTGILERLDGDDPVC